MPQSKPHRHSTIISRKAEAGTIPVWAVLVWARNVRRTIRPRRSDGPTSPRSHVPSLAMRLRKAQHGCERHTHAEPSQHMLACWHAETQAKASPQETDDPLKIRGLMPARLQVVVGDVPLHALVTRLPFHTDRLGLSSQLNVMTCRQIPSIAQSIVPLGSHLACSKPNRAFGTPVLLLSDCISGQA